MKKIALFSLIAAIAGVSAANAGWRENLGEAPVNGAWRAKLADAPTDGAWRRHMVDTPEAAVVQPKTEENVGGFVPASEPVVEEIEVTEE